VIKRRGGELVEGRRQRHKKSNKEKHFCERVIRTLILRDSLKGKMIIRKKKGNRPENGSQRSKTSEIDRWGGRLKEEIGREKSKEETVQRSKGEKEKKGRGERKIKL